MDSNYKIKKMSSQFLVSEIGRSLEFYTGKLGFGLDFLYQDFYAGIIKDGYSIHLKINNTITGANYKQNNDDVKLIISIEGIDHLYKEFQDKAIPVVQPLREMDYGKEFYIADPDGNIIAFVEEV